MTIDGIYSYLDFDSNLNYLTEELIIVTQSFNHRFNLHDNDYTCFIIPKKFRTDGASIPRITRPIAWLSPRDKAIFLPAIWHDYLYKEQKVEIYLFDKISRTQSNKLWLVKISRKEADMFIIDKMKSMWWSIRQRVCTYLWLRIGGWYQWNKATKILDNK